MTRTLRAALKVAEREFMERATSRAFLISNAVLVVALLVGFAIPTLTGGEEVDRLGYLPQAEDVATLAAERGTQLDTEVELFEIADAQAAQSAVRPPDEREGAAGSIPDTQLDAVLVDERTVVTWQELSSDLEGLLATATRESAIRSTLVEADLTTEQRQSLLTPPQLSVQTVGEDAAEQGPALATGAIGVFLLYGLLIFYGQYIAQGIVEEKSSRVVEVLLSTVRPTSLLLGKVLGLTALGLVQTLVLALVGAGGAVFLLDVTVPAEAYGTIALTIGWFVLGFLVYASLFAVAASLVSRQEDLQSTLLPAYIPIIAAFFIAQFALQNPRSTVAFVASLVPFTAPLVQPLRYASGVMEPWEFVAAVGLCLLTIAVLVPLAARLHSGSILRFGGRVRIGEAWRAARS